MKPNLALVISVIVAAPASAITIATVPVRDVGNPNDPATGNLYGGVSYAYSIGKYEVTVEQYTAFLNAVAATDTYGLYNVDMGLNVTIAGISRSGANGSYSYGVIGSPNHPVTYVNWGDAARFSNWLNNGQPSGAQNSTTTEDGAYTLNGATINALTSISRNPGARWFIPNENEWYKAAYYQPSTQGGDSDSYWSYPTRSSAVPYSDQPAGATPDNTSVANFYRDDGIANGYNDGYAVSGSTSFSRTQNVLTDVGAYTSSVSYYGTFDQAGNVWEWNEPQYSNSLPADRVLRGGSYGDSPFGGFEYVSSASRGGDYAFNETPFDGFRVAGVPWAGAIGDYSQNGSVDAADYIVWRKNSYPQSDYVTWRATFGLAAGNGATLKSTVPEPMSLSLPFVGALAYLIKRRRILC